MVNLAQSLLVASMKVAAGIKVRKIYLWYFLLYVRRKPCGFRPTLCPSSGCVCLRTWPTNIKYIVFVQFLIEFVKQHILIANHLNGSTASDSQSGVAVTGEHEPLSYVALWLGLGKDCALG